MAHFKLDSVANAVLIAIQDVRDDIKGAQDIGMVGMLVQTGKYRDGDENKIDPPPNYVCKSIIEAVETILSQLI